MERTEQTELVDLEVEQEIDGSMEAANLSNHEVDIDDIDDIEQKGELEPLDMDTALRWPCTVCELKFISRGGLDKHMNLAHSGAVVGEVEEGTNQDILAGGLFEDGSLFAEALASMPPSERQTESEFNDGPGDFGGPGSPGGLSSGGSRGASPAPLESMPGSPTPSHHSLASRASTARSMRSMRSEATARSEVGSMAQDGAQQATEVETTTLLHNGEESFALAPVEASAMKGPFRTKRKRKLIVDEVKAISGKEMKGQLSDTGDIVTTFDLAPPTKRLMHWKETGGVEKLFALPGRLLQSRYIHDDHSANLIVRASDAESFDMLGDNGAEPDLALEQVPGAKEFQEPLPPAAKETRKGRKRKNAEEEAPVESAYSKRQAELAMAVEEGTDMDIVVKACTEQSDEVNSNENVSIVESIENIKNCLGKFLDDKETEDSALETLAMPASLLCCLCNDTCCSVEDLGNHLRNTHGVKKEDLGELINKTMKEQIKEQESSAEVVTLDEDEDQEEIDVIEIVEVSDEDEDEDEVFFVSEHEGVCMTADEKEVFRKCFSKKNS